MKSLISSVSFLVLSTIVFHLVAVDAHGKSDPNKICVPKQDGCSDEDLQKQIDWACSQGIDCLGVKDDQRGCCIKEPLKTQAAYIFTKYYRLKGECNFEGKAQLSGLEADPSHGLCKVKQVAEPKTFCVPRAGVCYKIMNKQIEWACNQGIDCSEIKSGSCAQSPVKTQASYIFTKYYRERGECIFNWNAEPSSQDPSDDNCKIQC